MTALSAVAIAVLAGSVAGLAGCAYLTRKERLACERRRRLYFFVPPSGDIEYSDPDYNRRTEVHLDR